MHVNVMETKTVQPTAFTALFYTVNNGGDQADTNSEHLFRLTTGNFRGRKTFVNFTVLWLFAKVFSMKSGGVASFGAAQASNP